MLFEPIIRRNIPAELSIAYYTTMRRPVHASLIVKRHFGVPNLFDCSRNIHRIEKLAIAMQLYGDIIYYSNLSFGEISLLSSVLHISHVWYTVMPYMVKYVYPI